MARTAVRLMNRRTMVEAACASTGIEGNRFTRREVQRLAVGKFLNRADAHDRALRNYLATLRWIIREAPRKPLTERLVVRLHRKLMRGLLEHRRLGRYKCCDNLIISQGRPTYRPAPATLARSGVQALVCWLRGPAQEDHPVVASACAHYEIARLHPFDDGNGRLARVLGFWVLCARGFRTYRLFFVDRYFDRDRSGYYHALGAADKLRADLTPWIEYVASAVAVSLSRSKGADVRQEKQERPVQRATLTQPQARVVELLAHQPRMSVSRLEQTLGIKRAYLLRLLEPLIVQRIVLQLPKRPTVYQLMDAS